MKECSKNITDDEYYSLLDEVANVSVDIIRLFSFFFFLFETRNFYGFKKTSLKKMRLSWHSTCCLCTILAVSIVVSLLAIPTAYVSYSRDETIFRECDISAKKGVVITHAIFKAYVLFAAVLVSLSATNIIYSAKLRWDKVSLKEVMMEWDGKEAGLSEVVDKFYHLYNGYIQVGKDSELERKALKRWFVVMYSIYLIFILVRVIHILQAVSKNVSSTDDFANSVLTIFIHFVAFFLPYFAGAELNSAHKNYYRKMNSAFSSSQLGVESVTYLCRPGKSIELVDMSQHNVQVNEATPLLQPEEMSTTENCYFDKEMERKYQLYYKEALKVQGNIMKICEFDFVPSLLNVSIPLTSQGYTFTILLTIVSLVLNSLSS